MPSLFLFCQVSYHSGINASNLILTALIPKVAPRKDTKQGSCLQPRWESTVFGVSPEKPGLSKFGSMLWHWTSQRCLAVGSDAGRSSSTVCGKTHSLILEVDLISLALCYIVDFQYEKEALRCEFETGFFHSYGHFSSSLKLLECSFLTPLSPERCVS